MGIIKNISRSGKNRTLIYCEELKLKARFAAERKQEENKMRRSVQRRLEDPYGVNVGTYEDEDQEEEENVTPLKIPSVLENKQEAFDEWLTSTFNTVPSSFKDINLAHEFENVQNIAKYGDHHYEIPGDKNERQVEKESYEKIRPLLELEPERINLAKRMKKNSVKNSVKNRPKTATSRIRRRRGSNKRV